MLLEIDQKLPVTLLSNERTTDSYINRNGHRWFRTLM